MNSILSPHQLQVVALLANGKNTKEIILIMQVTRRTIGKYIADARRRMGAETREHLVALAVASRMVCVEVVNSTLEGTDNVPMEKVICQ